MAATLEATVQCPDLAGASMDAVILTKENVASLKVDISRTEPGTVVNVTCLAAPQFRLVGATTLTCLPNGQWDTAIPVCVPAAGNQSTNINTVSVSATNNTTGSDISMLPMIVIAGIVGVIFFSLAVVMVVILVQRGRLRNSHNKRRLDNLTADRGHMRSDPMPLDIGDIVDNVSSRCPPGPHVHGSERDHLPNTLASQPRIPRDHMSVSERSPRFTSPVSYNGPSQRESPSVHNYERQNIRTWHDLFFPGNY